MTTGKPLLFFFHRGGVGTSLKGPIIPCVTSGVENSSPLDSQRWMRDKRRTEGCRATKNGVVSAPYGVLNFFVCEHVQVHAWPYTRPLRYAALVDKLWLVAICVPSPRVLRNSTASPTSTGCGREDTGREVSAVSLQPQVSTEYATQVLKRQ